MRSIVWNSEERRPRLVPRLVLFSLLYALTILLVVSPLIVLAPWLQARGAVEAWALAYAIMGVAVATVASMAVAARILDRRPFRQYGFPPQMGWWLDLGFGLGLGAALMAGVFLVEVALGWITVVETFRVGVPGTGFAVALLVPLLQYLGVGVYEEALMRGYILRNLAEGFHYPGWGARTAVVPGWGARTAVVLAWLVSSGVFALGHAMNPGASLVSTVNLALAGLFLGLGFVLTGSLAIPIGLHITWNFFQGSVFGFPVSGTRATEATVFGIEQRGPDTWTGGAFGPEAGVLGVIAIAVGMALTMGWVQWRRGALGIERSLAEPPRGRGATAK